jgi:hypothetical protein
MSMNEREAVAEFERLAEAAYAAMYDVRPRNVKDCYDDAQLYFGQAIEAALRDGLADEVARLTLRFEHVRNVYNRQFRGVGR